MIAINYGKEIIQLSDKAASVLAPEFPRSLTDDNINGIIRQQVDCRAKRMLIVVPDDTRPGHLDRILPPLFNRLRSINAAAAIDVFVANGLHRTYPEPRLRRGLRLPAGVNLWQNHFGETESYRTFTTDAGSVAVSSKLFDYDCLLIVGVVEPHYLAGFSGSVKAIIPGAASRATVLDFHRLSLQGLKPGRLSPAIAPGDPIAPMRRYLEKQVATLPLPPLYAINLIADRDAVYYLNCGSYRRSFKLAVNKGKEIFGRTLPPVRTSGRLFIVSCGGHPFDVNLYQAHKSLINTFFYTRSRDTILFFCKCPDGYGSPVFKQGLYMSKPSLQQAMHRSFAVALHTAYNFRSLFERRNILVVSDLNQDRKFKKKYNGISLTRAREIIAHMNPAATVVMPTGHLVYCRDKKKI